jgi:riboflavin synthase
MFSGIVEEVGTVLECKETSDGRELRIQARQILDDLSLGDSVSVAGICLTAMHRDQTTFSVQAVKETLRRTILGKLKPGSGVNLEGALRFNDRLGGHLVTGHVDVIGSVKSIVQEGFSKFVTFELDSKWSAYFVEKGSVAVDGVSLTVAACDSFVNPEAGKISSMPPFTFSVALIPYTLEHTTLGQLSEGDHVNVETDVIARYVARWLAPNLAKDSPAQALVEQTYGLSLGSQALT